MENYIVYLICFICFGAALILILYLRHRIMAPPPMDEMKGVEFEKYCAELLKDCGFENVSLTPESGDYGIDILAQKDGIKYAIQCKRYGENVGIAAVQQAYAGCVWYDSMVAVVMTNQYYTAPAKRMAEKLKVLLWDREWFE